MNTQNPGTGALSLAEAAQFPTTGAFNPNEQEAIVQRVTLRLIPLLFLCYVIAYDIADGIIPR